MKFEMIRGILFAGLVLLLSMCAGIDQPVAPAEGIKIDSCINIPNASVANVKANLDKPVFSIPSDTVPYGTKVYLHPDSVASAGIFEISVDSGKLWVPAKCVTLFKTGEVWARRKYENVSSKIAKATFLIYYERVIIVGNSITGHGPAPEIGWSGDWGMAASSAEKDYVHIITKKLKQLNSKVEIKIVYGIDFENNYWQYDFTVLQQYADFKPDLVIMRIAENTNKDYLYNFENNYAKYISELTKKSSAKVICTTSFWSYLSEVTVYIRNVASSSGYILADLTPLWTDKSYTAHSLFENPDVGSHPSDKGMQAIADRISINF